MTRSDIIRCIADFLIEEDSPVPVLREVGTDDADIFPHTLVRAGTSQNLAPGQAILWDLNALVGVFHDAEASTADAAEEAAESVFKLLEDAAALTAFAAARGILISGFHHVTTEAALEGMTWRHIAGFQVIAAPDSDFVPAD